MEKQQNSVFIGFGFAIKTQFKGNRYSQLIYRWHNSDCAAILKLGWGLEPPSSLGLIRKKGCRIG